MGNNQQTVNMFWHGPRLGKIHGACIRSFLRHGHPVNLHCYNPPEDVPHGVALFDASRIMPLSDLIAHRKSGSVALGTNRYRYRLLRAGCGLYADCDMYCLRPIPEGDYIFGWEDSRGLNNAFLKYPPDCALALKLVAETANEFMIPPSLKPYRRGIMRLRRALGRPASVRHMRWGVWGPELLTHWVKSMGLQDKTAPIDHFYPLHFQNTDLLFEQGLRIEHLATPRTFAIHLWHKGLHDRPPPPSSPLHQIIEA